MFSQNAPCECQPKQADKVITKAGAGLEAASDEGMQKVNVLIRGKQIKEY
jgi:hypothetical protein